MYEIWLSTPTGTRLALLDSVESLTYAIVTHDVGVCELRLPGSIDFSLLAVDNRIEIWRKPTGGSLLLERVYLIRKRVRVTDKDGVRSYVVTGVDGNDQLRRRIVAYAAGSTNADMTAAADTMCREIVLDNLSTGALTARQLSTAYLTLAPSASGGPSVTKSFSRRNVLDILQDVAETAEAAGSPIYWTMADATPSQWQFRTSTGQPGIDHTYPDGLNPVMLSLEMGNLAEPTLAEDYTKEVTYAYAGGQGEEAARVIVTAEASGRTLRSPFGLCEGFADARNEDSTAGVLAAARRLLDEGKPRLRFAARLVDSPGTRYGVHWRQGDKVTAIYEGQTYDALIRAVKVNLDEQGKEAIEARLEVAE